MKAERIHYQEITSTNDYAKELINKYNRLILTADYQTAGRGRNEKEWLGNYGGNVYFTYAINHNHIQPFRQITYYQILGALAVFNTLKKLARSLNGEQLFKMKYPNDIYGLQISNDGKKIYKKISGILAEHTFMSGEILHTILGIGVNVNQTEFSEKLLGNVTSLKLMGFQIETEIVIQNLISEVENLLDSNENEIFNTWVDLLSLQNKLVRVTNRNQDYIFSQILNDCRLELIDITNNNNKIIIDNGDSIRYNL